MSDSPSSRSKVSVHLGQQFIRLYQANEARIYGYILSMIGHWSEADDLMQETASVMWGKFEQFEPGTDFAAWGMSIAHYEILNYLKKKKEKHLQFSEETMAALHPKIEEVSQSADQFRDALRKCLSLLPDKDRLLIKLRYEMGATVRSVSERIGRQATTVYKALQRIHARLYVCIHQRLDLEKYI
ncbi:MAG: sigma-70 family RNA polymerase sigma factor [Sedimentisphaerales bacterium]|nr:sigma-70 family RNA polymerase sigma factor [Sedimentisphaerales bacterium]